MGQLLGSSFNTAVRMVPWLLQMSLQVEGLPYQSRGQPHLHPIVTTSIKVGGRSFYTLQTTATKMYMVKREEIPRADTKWIVNIGAAKLDT